MKLLKSFAILVLLTVTMTLAACGSANFERETEGGSNSSGTTRGNPMVPLSVAAYSLPVDTFTLGFCLEEIVFTNPRGIRTPFPVRGFWVNLNPNGSALPDLSEVPNQTYIKIALIASTSCNGPSTRLTNANGDFQTNDTYTIEFDGNIDWVDGASVAVLDFQPLADQLASVTSDGEISTVSTAARGTF